MRLGFLHEKCAEDMMTSLSDGVSEYFGISWDHRHDEVKKVCVCVFFLARGDSIMSEKAMVCHSQ